ncbi:hypothetical protein U14_00914 [Candidatus Moduliflexus flocculans]|uniref:L,D-TPase catalytic domain-containing protein n=1 Tax=Candidatus Moduliflexus flocculans TaxID=1499966 RepID=A0A0S6VR21_9BACT|nr:hypothetical protein U14_00914 [Candidatus Moduliflexus flocculans]
MTQKYMQGGILKSMGGQVCRIINSLVIIMAVLSGQAWAQVGILQQQVFVNIPAYTLNLYTQYADQHWERLSIPVGVGKGADRKHQTPTGRGELYAKAVGVSFEYGPQNPKELVGTKITHSNTFDKATLKPVTIKMPGDMKSVFMKLTSDIDSQFYMQYVLHETTDWYTIGTAASSGCVRIDRDDMQRFYSAIMPTVYEGQLSPSVPITIYYDVSEYYPDEKMVVLHANIYHRPIDYVQEVLKDLKDAGIDTSVMNMAALANIVQQAEAQFDNAMKTISSRLKKAPFNRLIYDDEKKLLHFTFFLKFQY